MSDSKYSHIRNPLGLAAIIGLFVFMIGYLIYQMPGLESALIPGEKDQVQACVDKMKLRLNQDAGADFTVLDGSDAKRGNIMIKFTASSDTGAKREYIVLCQNNGGVHIL